MYAVSTSDEGDCYLCLPPDPGGKAAALGACEAAALGAGESALSGTASAQVFHTFTLDSGASRSFFRDRTSLTPLSRPVAVSLADPSRGPVLASFSTILPCPAAPSGTLSAASSQVFTAASRSGPESAPCSCRLLSHQTLLWHHRLGHPSLPRLRGMASRVRHWLPLSHLSHMSELGPAAHLHRFTAGQARVHVTQWSTKRPHLTSWGTRISSRGAEPVGAGSGGAECGGAESGGAEPGGAEPGGAESRGAEPGGAEPGGAESARVASRSASSRRELLSPQELREWFARRWSRAAGAGGPPVAPGLGGARTGATGAVGTGGATAAAGVGPAGASGAAGAGAAGGVGAGVGAAGASGSAGAGAAGGVGAGVGPAEGTAVAAGGTGAAGTGAAGVGAVGAGGAAGTGAATGGTVAVLVLGLPPSPGPAPSLGCPQPVQSQLPLQPVSPLPAPSPYAGPTGGLAKRREPASRPASPVCTTRTSRRAPCPRPPAVPGTHQMTLRPSTAPLRVPLPSPPESSLPVLADPESDSLRAASPTIARLLSTVVTDPFFESTAASALVAELVDFAASCRLDYATRLVAESESVCPPSVGGECALTTDVLEDRQEEFQCFAAALPHLVSTLIAPEGDPDAPDIPTPRS
ncbi:unnamed protein product [Closterium sp. NIES-54]